MQSLCSVPGAYFLTSSYALIISTMLKEEYFRIISHLPALLLTLRRALFERKVPDHQTVNCINVSRRSLLPT